MKYKSHQEIADLLFLAIYQDNHLSVEEDIVLKKALNALGWEENEESGLSIGKAFAAVREANSCHDTREAFIAERTTTIKAAGESPTALEWLGRILASDSLDPGEAHFLKKIEKLLFD